MTMKTRPHVLSIHLFAGYSPSCLMDEMKKKIECKNISSKLIAINQEVEEERVIHHQHANDTGERRGLQFVKGKLGSKRRFSAFNILTRDASP